MSTAGNSNSEAAEALHASESAGKSKAAKTAENKARLEAKLEAGEIDTVESRVAWLLNNIQATRESDTRLAIEYWQAFNSDHIEFDNSILLKNVYHLQSYNSISRSRSRIQNDYGLFTASEVVRARRGKLSEEEKQRSIAASQGAPQTFIVYADESKSDPILIIGSVWVIHPFQSDLLRHKIIDFSNREYGGKEFHSVDFKKTHLEVYFRLFDAIEKNLTYFGFKALRRSSHGAGKSADAVATLYKHLLLDGISHELESGRITLPRRIDFVKDEDGKGYDDALITEIKHDLQNASSSRYGGKLYVGDLQAVDSKTDSLVQLADIFTWSVNRMVNHGTDQEHWKNKIAQRFLQAIRCDVVNDVESASSDVSLVLGRT